MCRRLGSRRPLIPKRRLGGPLCRSLPLGITEVSCVFGRLIRPEDDRPARLQPAACFGAFGSLALSRGLSSGLTLHSGAGLRARRCVCSDPARRCPEVVGSAPHRGLDRFWIPDRFRSGRHRSALLTRSPRSRAFERLAWARGLVPSIAVHLGPMAGCGYHRPVC